MEWIIAGIVVAVIALSLILFPAIVWFVLAPSNRFFTFVDEGTAKIVVKAGQFNKALIQWEGHTFDDERSANVVPVGTHWVKDGKIVSEEEQGAEEKKFKEPHHLFGGLRFYGLWPLWDIYVYTFQWTGVTEDGGLDPHPKELLDYILVRDDVFLCEVRDAEDMNLLPLTLRTLLTIRIANPYKTLFNIENWLETIVNRTRPLIRNYVTQRSYEDLIKAQERMGVDILEALREASTLGTEFYDRYGVDLRQIDVKEIEPPQEYRDITLRKYTAERERERIITEADAEAQRIETVYSRIHQFDDLGKLVRILEAMEKSPGQGSKWIIPIPGMTELLSSVFEGRQPDAVTREEITELKAMVETLIQEKTGE